MRSILRAAATRLAPAGRRLALSGAAALALISGALVAPTPASASTIRDDIVSIATSQLNKTSCAPNGGYYNSCGIEWCANFARWVWAQAGVTPLTGLNTYAESFQFNGQSTGNWHPKAGYTPQPGDAIVFDWDIGTNPMPYDAHPIDHVALVTSVSGGRVYTIGGNQGSGTNKQTRVTRADYSLGYANIVGYTSPANAGSSAPATVVDGQLYREPSGAIAVVIGGAAASFATMQEITGAGYNPSSYTSAPAGFLSSLPTIPFEGMYIRDPRDGGIYGIVAGAKIHLGNLGELPALGNPTWVSAPSTWTSSLPTIPKDGSYLRTPDLAVYAIVGGAKLHVGSVEELALLGNPPLLAAPSDGVSDIPDVPTDGTYVRTPTTGAIYAIIGGAKVYLDNMDELAALGNPTIVPAPTAGVNEIPDAPADGTFVRTADTSIYGIVGGAKFHVFNAAELAQLGNPSWVQAPTAGIESLPDVPADGTIMAVPGNLAIYEIVDGTAEHLTESEWVAMGRPHPTNITTNYLNTLLP